MKGETYALKRLAAGGTEPGPVFPCRAEVLLRRQIGGSEDGQAAVVAFALRPAVVMTTAVDALGALLTSPQLGVGGDGAGRGDRQHILRGVRDRSPAVEADQHDENC